MEKEIELLKLQIRKLELELEVEKERNKVGIPYYVPYYIPQYPSPTCPNVPYDPINGNGAPTVICFSK